jgi:hypothetical protein
MALAPCRKCGKIISTDAAVCPTCGAPTRRLPDRPDVPPVPLFRKPSPQPVAVTRSPQPSEEAQPRPTPRPLSKAAREAVIRRRLVWGLGAIATLLVLLGLTRVAGSWVVLSPLALVCAVAVGLGLHTAIRGRRLPFFPQTRRAHGFLLALGAVLVWVAASQLVPQSLKEQQRLAAEQQQEAERQRQLHAQAACHIYIQARLKVPSTAEFSVFPVIVPRDGGGYIVKGSVEAQNAFGAKLHREYVCAADATGRVLEAGLDE